MKIVSCLASSIPAVRPKSHIYIVQYSRAIHKNDGNFGIETLRQILRSGIDISVETWDFATFALSIAAIDKIVPRSNSADGWTRVLDVEIHLHDPKKWLDQEQKLEELLRFLTGDFWHLSFKSGGMKPPKPRNIVNRNADCISLLSGGMDSLVGAIDLIKKGRKPIFVSHIVNGSVQAQRTFASSLDATDRHFLWSFESRFPGSRENSTRGRSLVFYAFAAIAADAIRNNHEGPVEVFVPENGFISLNIALSPGRLGSLSTKTTHPIFISGIQQLWDHLGLSLTLCLPYRFMTKGEMLQRCLDQDLLKSLVFESVSCGKYIRSHKHCGDCVPCLVRRSAFLKAGWEDITPYKREKIQVSESDNVAIIAAAVVRLKRKGLKHLTGCALSFGNEVEKHKFEEVFSRGFAEIQELLHKYDQI